MKIKTKVTAFEQYTIDFVRKLRITTKTSQEDVARIINVSKSFVGNIENLKHINMLAENFNISPRELIPPTSMLYETSKQDIIKDFEKKISEAFSEELDD